MSIFLADLHCHSTCSDGTKTAQELVILAKQIGLSGLSITDHDSIISYSLASSTAKKEGIKLLTGVEFSTMHRKTSIHILGYGFPPNSPILQTFCEKHHERRLNRNLTILDLLKVKGLPITEQELEDELKTEERLDKTVGRPHIALAMMRKKYVKTIQEAFQKYLGEGKCCYAEGSFFTTEDTVDLIHQAKGLAVIAHPHLISEQHILQELLQLKFDGIECYYARFPMHHHERWLKIAKRKNLIITGGSDYHGTIKPNLQLGSSFIDEPTFNILYDHFLKNL